MNRVILLCAAAAFLCLLSSRLCAQDVYADISATYIQSCNCMLADFNFSWDYIAEEDYFLNVSGQFDDTDNTFNRGFNTCDFGVGGCDVEIEADNPPLGDTFQASGYVTGDLEGSRRPEYACTAGMGAQFASAVGCCACYGVDALCNFISDDPPPEGVSISCGKGADLDNLMNEYTNPTMYPWLMPATTADAWKPACGSFTGSALASYSNADAFSPSDITDWRIDQSAFDTGLGEINATSRPSYVVGVPAEPIPVAQTGDIYRTPYHEYETDLQAHPAEPHQFGAAIDFAAGNSTLYQDLAAWAEIATGSSRGAINGQVCIEPEIVQGNYGHVHVDWRPEIYAACPTTENWLIDYITAANWP